MRDLVAGIDIGGTNIVAALLDGSATIVDRAKAKTPGGGPDAVVDAIVGLVGELSARPAAAGVGAPGPIADGVVTSAPNLAGWHKPVPLAARLRDALGIPVVVDNDANVGTLGEWQAGAGRGARFVLGCWLGTGVGGGLVLDGMPYAGAFGGAGEIGHLVVQRGGALCGCGRRGCLEAYAGRASMERMVAVATAAGHPTALHDLQAKKRKRRLTSGVWAEALASGDELATRVFDDGIDALGHALGGLVNLLDLDCVVLGGGFAEKLGQPLADRVARASRPWMLVPEPARERRFVVAELGDDSGVVGAAALARAAVG